MKSTLLIACLLMAGSAHAYSSADLREDCLAAEESLNAPKAGDMPHSASAERCIGYVTGFADSYAVSDYLAEKVGVRLNAFCLPRESDLQRRLVRSVLAQIDR